MKSSLENFLSWHIDGKCNLHTASLFKLTKCHFALLTHCWFYCSTMQKIFSHDRRHTWCL